MVVLVWRKDGSLRFYIDLRKLNNQTIKDAYSLLHINETLNSLQGSQWFSLFNLKSGKSQVKMDEDRKPLTSFTMGPLGSYKCEKMPFGLTNMPTTFQQLMETCLGDINLNWCIICVDDIVIFKRIWPAMWRGWGGMFQKKATLKLKPPSVSYSAGRSHTWGILFLPRE